MRLKDWRKYLGQRQGIVTRCFVYVFGDWWSGMSGALSIPFAALAVLNVFSARKEFVLLAFAALFITIGRLAYKSVPRFKISTCSVNERKSAQNYWGPNKPVIFYQVRVDLLGKGSVKDCCARLLKIQRDKDVRWEGQAVELTFSPGEAPDALSKTLNDEIPEYVDVVILPSDHSIFLGVKGRQWTYQPPLQEIFRERGKYLITIAVRGGIGATQKALLEFVWNEWDTSTLEVVNPMPIIPKWRKWSRPLLLTQDRSTASYRISDPNSPSPTRLRIFIFGRTAAIVRMIFRARPW